MRKPIVGAAAYLYVKSKTNEEIRDAERQKQSHKAVIDELEKSISELTKEQGSIQKETCKKYSQLSAEVKSIREKYSRQRNENFNSNSDIKSI